MRFLFSVMSLALMLAFGNAALQMQQNQDDFVTTYIKRMETPGPHGNFVNPMEDQEVREKFSRVCKDAAVATALLSGKPDKGC
ncbi:hypothetical protein [Azospirillum argentinense]